MDKILTLILQNKTRIQLTDEALDGWNQFFLSDVEKSGKYDKDTFEFFKNIYYFSDTAFRKRLALFAQEYDEIDIELWLELHQSTLSHYIKTAKDLLKPRGEEKDGYFNVPTIAHTLTEAFGSGLKKHLPPITVEDITRGAFQKGKLLTYFSINDPKTTVSLQYSLFENPDDTQLQSYERTLQGALGPYGLKVFYSLLAQCDDNKRQPFFYLDINKTLDRMGHKRDIKGQHQTNNRERLLDNIEKLAKVNWHIESREPDPKNRKKEIVRKISGPLINITAKAETYKVDKDTIDTGKTKPVSEGCSITIHEKIYELMDSQYSKFPNAFLTLDARLESYQIQLYPFINHQWRIGWNSYGGVIKRSLEGIIKKSGIPLHSRPDNRLDQVKKIISELEKMKNNKGLWIGDIKFNSPARPLTGRVREVDRLLSQIVTITASKDHPLRESMKDIKRIEKVKPFMTTPKSP